MDKPKRILITGGRDFKDSNFVHNTLTSLVPYFDPKFCLIHGGARGIDMFGHCWAFFQGCPVIRMDANWDYYGRKAGPLRNSWMLDYAFPDLLVAFPGGIGTANMIKQTRERNIQVYKVPYPGL